MTAIHYHRATNVRRKGVYEVATDNVSTARDWLMSHGYVISKEVEVA